MRDLVLLSGWGMPPSVLAPLHVLLANDWRVTLLDVPRGNTLVEMAQAALDAAPARAAWCGWSLGGMVAAQAATMQPSRIHTLATLATNLSFVARPGWSQAMPVADFAAFSAQFDQDLPTALARFQALQCSGARSSREDLRRLRASIDDATAPDFAALNRAALRAGLDVLRDSDLRVAAAALACPSLWLYGEYDALVPAAVAGDVARVVPGARTGVLPGASHVPFLQNSAGVADALNHFLLEYA